VNTIDAGKAISIQSNSTSSSTINLDLTNGTTNQDTINTDDIFVLQNANGTCRSITGANLRLTAGSNLSYGATSETANTLNLDNTITDLTKLTVGISPATDSTTGLETYGKVIASRIDSTGIQDLLYLNNAGGTGAESGIIFRTNAYNCVTRFDETNYKIGASDAILDGVLTEWMRVNATELKVSGDCNLTDGHIYKIDDVQIDSEDILYLSGVTTTLKTKIDGKQAVIDSSNRLNALVIGDGSVNNTEYARLNGITTAILQTSDKGAVSGVCPLNSSTKIDSLYYTDTTYLVGNNLSFDLTTTPDTINLSTTLTSMVKIVGATNLTLQTQSEIIFLSGFDGGAGGDDIIWKTNRGAGVV